MLSSILITRCHSPHLAASSTTSSASKPMLASSSSSSSKPILQKSEAVDLGDLESKFTITISFVLRDQALAGSRDPGIFS